MLERKIRDFQLQMDQKEEKFFHAIQRNRLTPDQIIGYLTCKEQRLTFFDSFSCSGSTFIRDEYHQHPRNNLNILSNEELRYCMLRYFIKIRFEKENDLDLPVEFYSFDTFIKLLEKGRTEDLEFAYEIASGKGTDLMRNLYLGHILTQNSILKEDENSKRVSPNCQRIIDNYTRYFLDTLINTAQVALPTK